MKNLLLFGLLTFGIMILLQYCDSKRDPYEVGSHWDYSISCENGFIYKTLDHRRGTILILNSDGTPLRCGNKRY